jgi:ribosome-binding protein aMBF1 (putative translation factor)
MAKSFDILRADLNKRLDALPDGEGDRIRERTHEQIEAEETAYASSLAELRKARTLTQQQLAATLGVTQAQVSRIEHQTDLYLSTLAGYLEAMGGHLELVGVFDTARVSLSLGAVAGDALSTV